MLKSMLQSLRDARATELEGEGAGEAGFTLIELMVVLLIIAILLAIAIPTFLGVVGGANDRATQSNLTNAVTDSAAAYQNSNQSFPAVATVGSVDPAYTWVATSVAASGSKAPNTISYDPSTDGQAAILAAFSPTNTCWYVLYSPNEAPATAFSGATLPTTVAWSNAGTYYGSKTATNASLCSATAAATATWTDTATATGSSYGTAGTE